MRMIKNPSEDTLRRLTKSRIEAETLNERDLRCPICGFKILTVFSDIQGHFSIKCPKCKEENTLNAAYFRRMKAYANRLNKLKN